MSKIAIKSSSSGTATFTIESPATNTDRTLVLPDVAGTVALTSQIPAAATIASTGEAQAGTNNTNFLTPLRLREGFNASGAAPVFATRAWVNFNGTGTVAIRASGNVSSITDNGVGDYTVNFATAMPDANYCVNPSMSTNYGISRAACQDLFADNAFSESAPTTSAFRIIFGGLNSTSYDPKYCCVSIFR